MSIHKMEGEFNFYDELYKSLDDSDNEDDANMCQITGLPLVDKFITMECNHHFNYDALYKEICIQKFKFKTYDKLHHKDQNKLRKSGLNYFIRCPYCRNIQFTILPYYEELGLELKYGVNSLDKTLPSATQIYKTVPSNLENYTFTKFGVTFKKGVCCHIPDKPNYYCGTFVSLIPNTDLSYCIYHYRSELKKHNLLEKKNMIEQNNKLKQELKNKKEEILNERKKLFEEKNVERLAKGLPPLKRLPILKKKVENEVQQQNNTIEQYIPEEEDIKLKPGCKSILKTGPNKGNQCCCKNVNENGLCKRHNPKNNL